MNMKTNIMNVMRMTAWELTDIGVMEPSTMQEFDVLCEENEQLYGESKGEHSPTHDCCLR
jgi:hypothetical protein